MNWCRRWRAKRNQGWPRTGVVGLAWKPVGWGCHSLVLTSINPAAPLTLVTNKIYYNGTIYYKTQIYNAVILIHFSGACLLWEHNRFVNSHVVISTDMEILLWPPYCLLQTVLLLKPCLLIFLILPFNNCGYLTRQHLLFRQTCPSRRT